MRLLHVVPALQHPSTPGSLRHYYFLRSLARLHSITLLAPARGEVTSAAKAEIASLAERLLLFSDDTEPGAVSGRSGWRRRSAHELRSWRILRKMRRAFLRLCREERFDVVLFHGKDVYPVIAGFRGLPIVADFCDATSMRQRQRLKYATASQLPRRLWRYLAAKRVERALLRHTPHVAFISLRDREAVLGADSRAAVIPNGIDLAHWTRQSRSGRPHCIVFTGVMSYAPNEDAALYLIESVLPRLRPHVPELNVLIVGRDPSAALLAAGRRQPDVVVTGYVADVRPYLERAAVFVAPLRYASGQQNKILEALAMEVPVVTTPVAADGLRLDAVAGLPLEVAEGAEGFAAHVLSLLSDGERRAQLAAAGRRYVQTHFDWDRSAAALETMCLEAADRARRHEVEA